MISSLTGIKFQCTQNFITSKNFFRSKKQSEKHNKNQLFHRPICAQIHADSSELRSRVSQSQMEQQKMMWEAGASTASSGEGGGGGGRRKPSWRERENNRRRERRRRAIAAKIYAGLRAQGNYDLPKHCDNNEVLKALCSEAGWIVEPDGTTYRKGTKPIPMEIGPFSTNITPSSSRNPSPPSSYFPSPIPSYQSSPTRETGPPPPHPFAFLLNSIPSSSLPHLRISSSAPVTPPLSSPTKNPNPPFNLEALTIESMSALKIPLSYASAPASPTRVNFNFTHATIPECDESETSTIDSGRWMNFQAYGKGGGGNVVPTSPTFNLMKEAVVDETVVAGDVKPWEGERIHEEGMMDVLDDLDLTLCIGNTHI